ncbi:MAG TPA: ABC transporter ATP-binding protein [Trebonia sp.]|nr:ABC transporter ATP-binding protein [Trebonia sp.]
MTLLEVKDLHVSFSTADGVVQAVRGVSFDVDAGRTLGIVGESGSGKTVLTQTLLALTPGAEVTGSAVFEGTDLLDLPEDQMRRVRGARIAVIFQDPLTSLHPLYRIGWQISEMIRAHDKSVSKKEARERSIDLLRRVGIPKPETRVDDYPHQFSGGMRQRAMIAMALSLEPKLIIADEPTTALDATVQAQILDLLLHLQQESGTALILITHDLGVVADIADDVMVMYAGRAAEKAAKRDVFYAPHHPYTKGLLESIPSSSASGARLRPIAGAPPSLINLPSGCKFHPRCAYVFDRCLKEEPALHFVTESGTHTSACWLPAETAGMSAEAEELRDEVVREHRGAEAAEVAAAAAAQLGIATGDEGSAA